MPVNLASSNSPQKGEGFPGQRIVVLPRSAVAHAGNHALMGGLIPTDAGYFPRAAGHLRKREAGVDQAILIFCTKGCGWCEIAGHTYKVNAGELLVIPPQTPHIYGAANAHPWSINWLHAQGPLLDGFLRELETTLDQPVARIGDAAQVLALFEEVLAVMEQGYTTQQLLCASHALAHLMAVLVREHRAAHHEQPSVQQRISQTIAYMKQHLNQPLQLNSLAAMSNLSRSRYTELFKQQAGYAPIEYFIRLRMHQACQLFDTTHHSVKVVAATLGYTDPLYFSRVFRSVNDLTPTEYRKLRKG
jgi:AraC-like DNA-binding protein